MSKFIYDRFRYRQKYQDKKNKYCYLKLEKNGKGNKYCLRYKEKEDAKSQNRYILKRDTKKKNTKYDRFF